MSLLQREPSPGSRLFSNPDMHGFVLLPNDAQDRSDRLGANVFGEADQLGIFEIAGNEKRPIQILIALYLIEAPVW